jgi:hypothetical protein
VWDEIFDTEHVEVVRTYIERWPRKDRAPEKVLIVVVQPDEEHRWPCPHCGQKLEPVEWDTRRWRTLDMHGKRCFLEADLPRVVCGEHGKVTAAVPWARHDGRFSMPFEEYAAWLAANGPWSKVCRHLRVTWDAVASMAGRVCADAAGGRTGWAGCGGSGSTRTRRARASASGSGHRGGQVDGRDAEGRAELDPGASAKTST